MNLRPLDESQQTSEAQNSSSTRAPRPGFCSIHQAEALQLDGPRAGPLDGGAEQLMVPERVGGGALPISALCAAESARLCRGGSAGRQLPGEAHRPRHPAREGNGDAV
jgi:hypothetical protein